MPDAIFDHPRLARVYDPLDFDRSDLDPYLALLGELGARRVLDVGCGTGTYACLVAGRGIDVTAVDPAAASLDVARSKPHANRVRWVHGDATTLPLLQVDLAVMTANVAQVFLTDQDWAATLQGIHDALRPNGWLVFETRDPKRRAWHGWTKDQTHQRTHIPGTGFVESWNELDEVVGQLVKFCSWTVFDSDGAALRSDSTLRFRSRGDVQESLAAHGYAVRDVRDAPDRPGREMVFVAQKVGSRP